MTITEIIKKLEVLQTHPDEGSDIDELCSLIKQLAMHMQQQESEWRVFKRNTPVHFDP